MVELTHRNTRRYGGYLVHVGMVIMFIGFTGKAFDKDTTVEVAPGRPIAAGHVSASNVGDVECGAERELSRGRSLHGRRLSKNGEELGDADAGAAVLPRLAAADLGSRDPAPSERGSVFELRGHVRRRSTAAVIAGLRVSAGELDLDRILGGAVRHHDLPDAEQDAADLSADGSGGDRGKTCESGTVEFS